MTAGTQFRVGLGHDTHRLEVGRSLKLGGVLIEFDRGLAGHSDADVLLHAITDALLGAAGLGDIGQWFPNTDERWAGADSAQFVNEAVQAIREKGWNIANLDCTIYAQQPKLTPHKVTIANQIAELLDIDSNTVNVKAKTGENVGPIGRGEAMSADAIVLLYRIQETETGITDA